MPHKEKKFTNHYSGRSFPAVRTDLAAELDLTDRDGVDERTETRSGFGISTIRIRTKAAAERLGKPTGEYITIDIGKIWLEGDERVSAAAGIIAGKLARLAEEMCGEIPERILIAGLGNRHITADALGDEVVGMITVTRHVKANRELFGLLGGREISAIAPGVLGETGIETAKLVAGAVRAAKPQIVVAVDALAALDRPARDDGSARKLRDKPRLRNRRQKARDKRGNSRRACHSPRGPDRRRLVDSRHRRARKGGNGRNSGGAAPCPRERKELLRDAEGDRHDNKGVSGAVGKGDNARLLRLIFSYEYSAAPSNRLVSVSLFS